MTNKINYKQTEIGEIPGDWEVHVIDEIKSDAKYSVAMGPFGSNITKDNFVEDGVPVIRGNNLGKYILTEEDFVFITDEKADELKASNVFPGDICITHRGTLGQVSIVPKDSKYSRYIISQSGMKLTCNEDIAIPEFVNYFLNSPQGQSLLLSYKSQVGVPSIAQPSTSLKKIIVPIPITSEQKRIVAVLESLDNKIELNRRMNKTLEEIGKALFKHWFVDFEFPNENGKPYKSSGGEMMESELGEIPKGWEVQSLDGIAEFLNGIACQKYPPINDEDALPVIKIADLRGGFSPNTDRASSQVEDKYHICNGDVLFSWSGSLEVCLWPYGDGILNQHLFKVSSPDYPKWFYYYWTLEHLGKFRVIASSKATTMGHIQRRHLTDAKVLVPQKVNLESMAPSMQLMLDKQISNNKEIAFLSEIRDLLLPRLMSGKIRVN